MTRLSWGRRPQDGHAITSRPRSAFIVVAALVALCASVDGFVHRSIIEADTPERIQLLLDQHLRTLERRDLFQYERTLDRQSATHTRCMRELYEMGEQRASALRPDRLLELEEAALRTTLVRAYIEQRDGIATEFIRRVQVVNLLTLPPFDIRSVFSVWYLTSPEAGELGERRAKEANGVALTYWEIDERASEAVAREAAVVRDEALRSRSDPGRPLRIRLAPAREHGAGNGCGLELARYDAAADEIVLYPQWQDARRAVLSERTREALRREAERWAGRVSAP